MTRRIEIELTSKLDDGRYTWRAAGAREPRGTLDASLVPDGTGLGVVLRAEIDSGIDGVDVLAIMQRKEASPLDPRGEAIQMIGPPKQDAGVQVTLAEKGRGRRFDREDRDDRGGRGSRGPRERGRPSTRRDGPREGGAPGDRPRAERSGADRSDGPRPDRPERAGRPERTERPRGAGSSGPSHGAGASGPPRGEGRGRDDGKGREDPRGRGDRRGGPQRRDARRPGELAVSMVHRNALLATLGPEQLPVAEQLLRGGLPAVRQAIDEQNRAALAAGRPTVAPETILAIADDLLPLTSLAAWKDRAAAVHHAGPSVRLRDLRPVVTSARTVTLDEEARGVLKELQGILHVKVEELRASWIAKVTSLLEKGEVVESLTVVSRPPDSATRCPAELAAALTEAAGKALDPELPPPPGSRCWTPSSPHRCGARCTRAASPQPRRPRPRRSVRPGTSPRSRSSSGCGSRRHRRRLRASAPRSAVGAHPEQSRAEARCLEQRLDGLVPG